MNVAWEFPWEFSWPSSWRADCAAWVGDGMVVGWELGNMGQNAWAHTYLVDRSTEVGIARWKDWMLSRRSVCALDT